MGFSNQESSIITDSMGNLYNFLLSDGKITLIYFDKLMGNVEKNVAADSCREEFHSIIDQYDNVYLIYQELSGDIKLLSFIKGVKQSEIVESNLKSKAYNLRIIDDFEDLHGFYCVPNNSRKGQFNAYHCQRRRNKWLIEEIGEISIYDILNPYEVIKIKDELILGYYDLVNGVEQLFIKRFILSEGKWSNGVQLTSSPNKKIYLDILAVDGDLHITYSEVFEGNYIIKYQCFKVNQGKPNLVHSHILSNPSNCSHPTLVKHGDKLWDIWMEHDSVISTFSEDIGGGWSDPYLWNESKRDTFNRYRFSSNDNQVKRTYNLNYSFGKQYPDITFLGFGILSNTTKIPLKKKEDSTRQEEKIEVKKIDYKEELDDIYSTFYRPRKTSTTSIKPIERKSDQMANSMEDLRSDVEKIHKEIKGIKESINDLEEAYNDMKGSGTCQNDVSEEDIKKLSNRLEQIEEFLTRRRRGLFQR